MNIRGARRAKRALVLAIVIASLTIKPASAAGSVYIHNGPDGEIQISTPWGDYAAYDEGGGLFWVGTQREFDKARVVGISKSLGMRESSVQIGKDSTAEFVEERSLRTQVGSDIRLDEIVPEIDFDSHVVGHSLATWHVLSVLWIQGANEVVGCFIYDPKLRRSYSARRESVSDEWRSLNIALPNDLFKRRVVLVFTAPHRKPGVIGLQSLTRWDYEYVKQRIATLPPDPELHDQKQLQHLLKFDPTILSSR